MSRIPGFSDALVADVLAWVLPSCSEQARAGNPSLDLIQRAAEALDVSVAELLGSQPKATPGKPGPTPQLQLRFDQIRRLPRKEQAFVIRFIDTVLEKAQKV